MKDEKPDYKQMVRDQIMQKYGPQNREAIVAENADAGKGFNWRALGAGIGTTLQGQGAQGAQAVLDQDEKKRQAKLDQFDKGRAQLTDDFNLMEGLDTSDQKAKQMADQEAILKNKRDPNSIESKTAQMLALKMMPSQGALINTLNAEQLEARFPQLSKFYESDQARALKDKELNAKAQEEQLKAMKEQQKIDRAVGDDQVRKQIFEKIPSEDLQKQAIKEYGEFKKVDRISQRIDRLLNDATSAGGVIDRAKGEKIKGELMQEIKSYMMNAQRTPEERSGSIEQAEQFLNMLTGATAADLPEIKSMALGVVQNLAKTDVLDGMGIRPDFSVSQNVSAPKPKPKAVGPKSPKDLESMSDEELKKYVGG